MNISIMEITDDEDKIINNPLVILENIQLLIHTPIGATCPMMSLVDVMSILVNLRQNENKDILYYLEMFKKERNIANIQLGKHSLDSFTKNTTEYIKLENIQNVMQLRNRRSKFLWQFCF